MKRVLFANRFYWPAKPATGQLLTDLAVGLAAEGWDVSVITSRGGAGPAPALERDRGVLIRRVRTPAASERTLLRKAIAFAVYACGAWFEILRRSRRGTIVVAMTDPPLLSFGLGLAARLRGARIVYWLQDLYPEIAVAVSGRRWFRLLRVVRDPLLAQADLCVAISGGLRRAVLERVPHAPVVVIENWAPSGVTAAARDDAAVRELRRSLGWEGRFVVGYSGNLGRVHDLDAILEAARLSRDHPRVRFAFVGTGPQRAELESRAAAQRLSNVSFHDAVPREQLAQSLAAIDVHLVTLRRGCERYVYPSKFYGIVAAGRPLVFVGPPDCEMAEAVGVGGFGLAVDSGVPTELATAILQLADNPTAVARLAEAAAAAAPAARVERGLAQWVEQLERLCAC